MRTAHGLHWWLNSGLVYYSSRVNTSLNKKKKKKEERKNKQEVVYVRARMYTKQRQYRPTRWRVRTSLTRVEEEIKEKRKDGYYIDWLSWKKKKKEKKKKKKVEE